jgi:hypothetical protein
MKSAKTIKDIEKLDLPNETKAVLIGKIKEKKSLAKPVATETKVELISYSMKMTIPTGQYANIIPEIVVKAGTIEQAHDYIAPHFNKLWKEYYLVSERRPEPVKPTGVPIVSPETTPAPASSVAFTKASQAITSCLSHKAMEMLKNQIAISTKLTPEDKEKLQPLIVERIASGQLTE